jgi:hypothetical protein
LCSPSLKRMGPQGIVQPRKRWFCFALGKH